MLAVFQQMTILDAMGNEVGVKRSCLESFLTSYVMFVAPNSSSSRALTHALLQKKQVLLTFVLLLES